MNYVTTNLRFLKSEYDEIKKIAFRENTSVASLIREAVKQYKNKKLLDKKERMKIFKEMVKSSIKINTPVESLIKEGRKFE